MTGDYRGEYVYRFIAGLVTVIVVFGRHHRRPMTTETRNAAYLSIIPTLMSA